MSNSEQRGRVEKTYKFDNVLGEECTQDEVFMLSGVPEMLERVVTVRLLD